RARGEGCPTAAIRSVVPARWGSGGVRGCPKGPREGDRQWRGRSQHRDRMLESEQTLIPAFPRGPDAGVPALETVSGLEALPTAHGASAYRIPAVKHTPSLRRVTRHPAGNRAFRIAE